MFHTLLIDLGQRIALDAKIIASNSDEVSIIMHSPEANRDFARIMELMDSSKRLKSEMKELLILQLKIRSLLRNSGESVLLTIEEQSGFWIDEATENFILAKSSHTDDTKSCNAPQSLEGSNIQLNGASLVNMNMPENFIQQYVQLENFEMCSILINSYSSKN
ncbi:MAG: hypothetical protein H6536_04435 [Bacteroidales bacterium]|nr:hypothetical protein [Bacteroidales bacterium]